MAKLSRALRNPETSFVSEPSAAKTYVFYRFDSSLRLKLEGLHTIHICEIKTDKYKIYHNMRWYAAIYRWERCFHYPTTDVHKERLGADIHEEEVILLHSSICFCFLTEIINATLKILSFRCLHFHWDQNPYFALCPSHSEHKRSSQYNVPAPGHANVICTFCVWVCLQNE